MNEIQKKEFSDLIHVMAENGLTEHAVLIGSWAEFTYVESGILPGYDYGPRTRDIDLLIKNMRLPRDKVNIYELAEKAHFTPSEPDYISESVKFYSPSGELEVEFLIGQKGAGKQNYYDTNFGIKAEALRHTEIALSNIMKCSVFGVSVLVPTPEAYVVGKAVINYDRKPNKKEKDAATIIRMWPFLDKSEVNRIVSTLTKSEHKHYMEFMTEHKKEISSLENIIDDPYLRAKNRTNEERFASFSHNYKEGNRTHQ